MQHVPYCLAAFCYHTFCANLFRVVDSSKHTMLSLPSDPAARPATRLLRSSKMDVAERDLLKGPNATCAVIAVSQAIFPASGNLAQCLSDEVCALKNRKSAPTSDTRQHSAAAESDDGDLSAPKLAAEPELAGAREC